MRRISYNKLWKKLIDVKWTKQKLAEEAKISSASVTKLTKDANITTEVLLRICNALNCDIGEIMEVIDDKKEPDSSFSANDHID